MSESTNQNTIVNRPLDSLRSSLPVHMPDSQQYKQTDSRRLYKHRRCTSDEADAVPHTTDFTHIDFCILLISIITFLVDIGTDVWMMVHFCSTGRIWQFALTLTFVLVPAITMTGFSLRWYLNDADYALKNNQKTRVSLFNWILRIVFLMFQLGPILRYLEVIYYGLKSKRARRRHDNESHVRYYIFMIYKDADASLLRLFESFMESAPQLVLQLYILFSGHVYSDSGGAVPSSLWLQLLTISTSLVSLAWSMCSYQRSLRYSLPYKRNISLPATVVLFLWNLLIIGSRVLALALFASHSPTSAFVLCVCHSLLMCLWLLVCIRVDVCSSVCEQMLFNLALGCVFLFTYINVKRDEPTRHKLALYHTVYALENIVMICLWFYWSDASTSHYLIDQSLVDSVDVSFEMTNRIMWWRTCAMIAQPIAYFGGFCLMLIYYIRLHPCAKQFTHEQQSRAHDVCVVTAQPVRENQADASDIVSGESGDNFVELQSKSI